MPRSKKKTKVAKKVAEPQKTLQSAGSKFNDPASKPKFGDTNTREKFAGGVEKSPINK